MDTALTIPAALLSFGFAARMVRDYLARPRPHAAVWAAAFAAYALATGSLAWATLFGWTPAVYRVFYLFGAIVNVPLLAVGSVYLLFGESKGRAAATVASVVVILGAFAVLLAPVDTSGLGAAVPAGSDVYAKTFTAGNANLPSPRIFAGVAGGVAAIVVIGLAVFSAVRWRRRNPRLAKGNVLIAVGTLFPTLAGSMTALGEAGGLAASLLAGIATLWWGYTLASTARHKPNTASPETV
ncbi:MAG: hypothetical protein IIC71_01405 [Acidobacteria bacterium]|nr:hypothetical protein [Acidobacteriota bacterium]